MNIVADVESFVRPTPEALSAMVETFDSLAQVNSSHAVGGIFVLTPYSVSSAAMKTPFTCLTAIRAFPMEHSWQVFTLAKLLNIYVTFFPLFTLDLRLTQIDLI